MMYIIHSQENSCQWNNREGEKKCISVFLERKTQSRPLRQMQRQKHRRPFEATTSGCAQFSSGANKLSNQLTKGKVLYERKNAKGRRLRKWITSASPSNIQQWKRGVKMSNREKEILHIPLTTKKKKQHPLTNQPRKPCRTHTHTCTKQHFFFLNTVQKACMSDCLVKWFVGLLGR